MANKVYPDAKSALEGFTFDGMSVMSGGFGLCGIPENLIIALQSYGVGSCWVAGDKKEYAEPVRRLLGVPDHYTLVSLLPAGYPADIALQKKKEQDEIVFFDQYKED